MKLFQFALSYFFILNVYARNDNTMIDCTKAIFFISSFLLDIFDKILTKIPKKL